MGKIRVLVVDDSAVIRRILSDIMTADPNIEVVGMAGDGEMALAKMKQLNPDVVTLDMEMPVLDGLGTLREIRKINTKLPVIMFSTLTERGSCATMDALALGASDYVAKPANVGSVLESSGRIRDELIPKIKALCRAKFPDLSEPSSPTRSIPEVFIRKPPRPRRDKMGFEVLCIGVSTGGPNALAELIPGLGRNFPIPVVIVQHMPALFTKLLAERLGMISGLKCKEGIDGQVIGPGEVWIAPGGFHMELERVKQGVMIKLQQDPPENSCRPAVDVLFRSVAKVYGSKVLSVVLTGMGQDGMKGCGTIRDEGGQVFIQDEASSVVWGMPGAVHAAGFADKVLPLKDLAQEINRCVGIVQPTDVPKPGSVSSTFKL